MKKQKIDSFLPVFRSFLRRSGHSAGRQKFRLTGIRPRIRGRSDLAPGMGMASVLERLAFVRGVKVQLSRIFAFLGTQKLDGSLGNSRVGSTVSRACKLAIEVGCPPEELTGYPRSYPGRGDIARILSADNYAAGEPYRASSRWRVSRDDHDETLNFLGGGGGILFGIAWRSGMIPRDRIVRKFRPGNSRSGHAMCVLGYDRNGNPLAANSPQRRAIHDHGRCLAGDAEASTDVCSRSPWKSPRQSPSTGSRIPPTLS